MAAPRTPGGSVLKGEAWFGFVESRWCRAGEGEDRRQVTRRARGPGWWGARGGDRPPGSQPGSLWDVGRCRSAQDLTAPPWRGEAAGAGTWAEEWVGFLLPPRSSRPGEFRGAGQLWK